MTMMMFPRAAGALAALLLLTGVARLVADEPAAKAEGEWVQLFNGKDLTGWTPKIRGYELGENYNDTFRVENGAICVRYDKWTAFDAKFGHLFYKDQFANYRLRIEYRFVGDQCPGGPGWATRNSGAMILGQAADSMGKDQDFPVSIEVQFLGGLGKGKRTTCNLCTPGTHVVMDGKLIKQHCITSSSKTVDGDTWVTAEIVSNRGQIEHYCDGELVLKYSDPQYDDGDGSAKKLIQGDDKLIRSGTISLQAESHPVEFRKVEILELK